MSQETGAIAGDINTSSYPSDLAITDMRFCDVVQAPMHCTLMKLYTNQGLVGLGEVRDGGSRTYALQLKERILGENPCQIDKLFRRIKQFGSHGRQGGGVSGIEIALWDLAGKAYGVPVYQMLGGKFRDRIRMYCDTDCRGRPDGSATGRKLAQRMRRGYTFLKMDLGIGLIAQEKDALSAPLGFLDAFWKREKSDNASSKACPDTIRLARNRRYNVQNTAHPFTGIHVTETGLDRLEEYVSEVRGIIGYEVPLAMDHFGHIPLEDCIKLARRLEKHNPAWLEDMLPWQYTDQYARLARSTTAPICTGEDIYLKESFRPLLGKSGVAVIHPDILTCGGIMEMKKIGDMAEEHGVAMAVHMAESPVACMAAVHCAAATSDFLALEFHSVDVPWWPAMAVGLPDPLVQSGFISVPDKPGLGIDDLNDEVLSRHLHPDFPELWAPTDQWNGEWAHDRLWS